MKPETFINLIIRVITLIILVWGFFGNIQAEYLVYNLVMFILFAVIYRKDWCHPREFSFTVRFLALGLAIANARLMTGGSFYMNMGLMFILASIYYLLDAYIPVLAHNCGIEGHKKPMFMSKTVFLHLVWIIIFGMQY